MFYAGLDFAHGKDFTKLVIIKGKNEILADVNIRGVSLKDQRDIIKYVCSKNQVKTLVVEQNGIGVSILELLKEEMTDVNVIGLTLTYETKNKLVDRNNVAYSLAVNGLNCDKCI